MSPSSLLAVLVVPAWKIGCQHGRYILEYEGVLESHVEALAGHLEVCHRKGAPMIRWMLSVMENPNL